MTFEGVEYLSGIELSAKDGKVHIVQLNPGNNSDESMGQYIETILDAMQKQGYDILGVSVNYAQVSSRQNGVFVTYK